MDKRPSRLIRIASCLEFYLRCADCLRLALLPDWYKDRSLVWNFEAYLLLNTTCVKVKYLHFGTAFVNLGCLWNQVLTLFAVTLYLLVTGQNSVNVSPVTCQMFGVTSSRPALQMRGSMMTHTKKNKSNKRDNHFGYQPKPYFIIFILF